MKNLTDFRKTVETGVDPRLERLSGIEATHDPLCAKTVSRHPAVLHRKNTGFPNSSYDFSVVCSVTAER